MNTKTTPEEAKALAVKYAFFLIEPENVRLAALIDEARATEREACAKVCDDTGPDHLTDICAHIIRSMGQASEQPALSMSMFASVADYEAAKVASEQAGAADAITVRFDDNFLEEWSAPIPDGTYALVPVQAAPQPGEQNG